VHSPGRITNAASGQIFPGGQVGKITHGPPHIGPPHWGVGVARGVGGVGSTGTQSQLPFALSVHWPCSTGMSGPSQILPSGHGNGMSMVHAPPHTAPVHCGVGVGWGVRVGGGETGMHPQVPVESTTHSPSRLGNSGHGSPGGQVGPITHGPAHGTLVHWGPGVGSGQPPRQPWKAARQVARLPLIVAAHCTRQLMSPAPPAALQPWTHFAPAANASAKHFHPVSLQPATHGAALAAGVEQVVMQSARVA
jgi:hypothetical protein